MEQDNTLIYALVALVATLVITYFIIKAAVAAAISPLLLRVQRIESLMTIKAEIDGIGDEQVKKLRHRRLLEELEQLRETSLTEAEYLGRRAKIENDTA